MNKFNTKGSRFSILLKRDAGIHHNKSQKSKYQFKKCQRVLLSLLFFFIVVLANFLNPLHKEQNKSKAYNLFSTDKS